MARIPAAELERLKGEVSLVRLAETRGVRLERRGGDLVGLCPFYDDREPSRVVGAGEELSPPRSPEPGIIDPEGRVS